MITGNKPGAPPSQGPSPGDVVSQPEVSKKTEPVDSMSYHEGPSKAQPASVSLPPRRFVKTAETERERLRPVPPRLPIQPGPPVDETTVLKVSQDDGGDDQRHILAPNKGLMLVMRQRSSIPSYWTFEGLNVDPQVHEGAFDPGPGGVPTSRYAAPVIGGGTQTLHYTWSQEQLEKMGKSFTVTAKLTHPSSGTMKAVVFHIERE